MKPKMKLDDLRVDSFVTDIEDKRSQTVKGGTLGYTETPFCSIGVACTGTAPTTIASRLASCSSCVIK